jgi:hypothetical protein
MKNRNIKKFKIGDKARVIKTIHGTCVEKGSTVEIIQVYGAEPMYTIKVLTPLSMKGQTYSAFSAELSPPWNNWKEKAEYLREEVIETETELKSLKQELDMCENYKDEEDYLAHKIVNILKNKDDADSIRIILKEFKTDLL